MRTAAEEWQLLPPFPPRIMQAASREGAQYQSIISHAIT